MMHVFGLRRRFAAVAVTTCAGAGFLAACSSSGSPSASSSSTASTGRVLLVGTYNGKAGGYTTIQSAVNAAHSGDWILVAPGDYHETDDHTVLPASSQAAKDKSGSGDMGGVLITTPGIHLRGMNRSSVIVDGDLPSAPSSCDPGAQYQDYGVAGPDGKPVGRNGIVAFKANNVSIDNLTVCNFLAGTGSSGNEIWWNGDSETGNIGLTGYWGTYLTATSTFYGTESSAAQYGIFSSAAVNGTWDQMYASNFNDSGYYVGACQQVCNMTINHIWAEYSALGYSGTNSGGSIVVENSQFDNNKDGFDTNTQIAGDPPAPQDGSCPDNGTSPITHTHSCWVFMNNNVHDNNNPNVPQAGSASNGPVGTGMSVSGGRNDTIMNNTFSNNGAWGVIFVPYPDSGTPSIHQVCEQKGGHQQAGLGCVFDPEGDALQNNTFSHNGFFGNPSNGDYGQITLYGGEAQNCFSGNIAPDGSTPKDLSTTQATCGATTSAANTGGDMLGQVLCDTGFGSCPAGANYPAVSTVAMAPLPSNLPSMADPCKGVPANPWCSGGSASGSGGQGSGHAMHVAVAGGTGAGASRAARTGA